MINKLLTIAKAIDQLNNKLGSIFMWLGLMLVLVQFSIVVAGHVFHVGFIGLQELLFYINSLLFLGGAGYALLHDEHVRVDIFYREASDKKKHLVNLLGTIFLLFPVLTLVWISATPFVVNSWKIFEGSVETSGLQAVFILKTFILVFAASLTLQGLAMVIKAIDGLMGAKSHD